MKELVERLRSYAGAFGHRSTEAHPTPLKSAALFTEAADEIERATTRPTTVDKALLDVARAARVWYAADEHFKDEGSWSTATTESIEALGEVLDEASLKLKAAVDALLDVAVTEGRIGELAK